MAARPLARDPAHPRHELAGASRGELGCSRDSADPKRGREHCTTSTDRIDGALIYKAEMICVRRSVLSLALASLALGCSVPVAASLDEVDANRVVVALDQSGIDAAKEVDPTTEGKFRVTVA